MESMVQDMVNFRTSLKNMKVRFDKERYIWIFQDNPKLEGENNVLIDEIEEVVEFSIPLIKNRIDLGHFILKKQNQLLY